MDTKKVSDTLLLGTFLQVCLNEKEETERCPSILLTMKVNMSKAAVMQLISVFGTNSDYETSDSILDF